MLTTLLRNRLLDTLRTYWVDLRVVDDPTMAINLSSPIAAVNTYVVGYPITIPMAWGSATNGYVRSSNTVLGGNPLMFGVSGGKTTRRYVLSASGTIHGIIELPTPHIFYSVQNAHFINQIQIDLTEV